jgi:hypothetical protein
MDFILFSAIQGTLLLCLTISYDIACQWSRNLPSRLRRLPQALQISMILSPIMFAIPKFHINAHMKKCHSTYSLNLRPGAGRVDGEAIEREWAKSNLAANSTKEMTSGSRHDTLDDIFGDLNWKTIVATRACLICLIAYLITEVKQSEELEGQGK